MGAFSRVKFVPSFTSLPNALFPSSKNTLGNTKMILLLVSFVLFFAFLLKKYPTPSSAYPPDLLFVTKPFGKSQLPPFFSSGRTSCRNFSLYANCSKRKITIRNSNRFYRFLSLNQGITSRLFGDDDDEANKCSQQFLDEIRSHS